MWLKCKLDAQDKFGDTALHFAARNGHAEVCDYLIKNCISLLSITNQEGKNALTYALENSQTSAAQVMKNYGSKPSYGDIKAKLLDLAKKRLRMNLQITSKYIFILLLWSIKLERTEYGLKKSGRDRDMMFIKLKSSEIIQKRKIKTLIKRISFNILT